MAIGSAPEIGAKFGGLFKRDEFGWLTEESMRSFYTKWRPVVGDDLQGGWATLHFAPRYENGVIPEGMHPPVQPPSTRDT